MSDGGVITPEAPPMAAPEGLDASARLAVVLDHFPGLFGYIDRDLVYRMASRGYGEWLGLPVDRIVGRHARDVLPEAVVTACEPHLMRALAGETVVFRRCVRERGGEPLHEVTTLVPDIGPDGTVRGVAITTRDATEQVMQARDLARERERALVTLHSIADAVITVDWQGRVAYMNPVAETLTGWQASAAIGRPVSEVFVLKDEGQDEPMASPVEQCLEQASPVNLSGDTVLAAHDGETRAVDVSVTPLQDADGSGSGAVIAFRDVGQARRLSSQLAWQATHDPLTSLPNRRHFERCVEHAIETAVHGEHHDVIYVDLDQFKVVNDTCGHAAGDRLLREVAEVLGRRLRRNDVLARLGGDEFGVLLRDSSIERAMRVAEALRAELERYRFEYNGESFAITGSFGVIPVDATSGHDLEALMRAADAVCYLAKDEGRNRVRRFEPNHKEVARRQGEMEWVARVRRALDEGRFVLYGQAIEPLGATGGRHFEVLVRMKDENGGIVPPMTWIPGAERYGLMPRLDRWVIREALRHLGRCNRLASRDGFPLPACAINLSGTTVSEPGLLEYVCAELATHGVQPGQVCFEITETAAIGHLAAAQKLMRELRRIGVRFALDDFGAGMSSFGYLKSLPVDFLKIDGAFVRRIAEDPVDYAMVEAINNLGHVMGIRTIAEFVESEGVLARLRLLGVDFAQGYGIAAPVPLDSEPAIERCGEGEICQTTCKRQRGDCALRAPSAAAALSLPRSTH